MKQYTLKIDSTPPKLTIDYRRELNDEQYEVVTTGDGPCLVLAGAGSGKTRTLVYRVAYLLEHGVPSDRILLVTFTNKAAKEMLHRIELLLKTQPKGLWGGTFHHLANRTLRIYGKHIGIDPQFTILDSEDAKDLIKNCIAEVGGTREKYFPKAELIYKIVSLAANLNQSVEAIMHDRFSYLEDAAVSFVATVSKRYKEKKQSAKSLDFDDLLVEWNRLLLESPEVREKLSKKFQYVLVDEYQDTNIIQGEIIRHLAGEHEPNVLAVGDDSQSIYSFRGATVKNILNFPKIFPNCQTFKLETNYRSTPEILALANASIHHNVNQFDKQLKTSKPSSDKPALVKLFDVNEQAEFIAQRILELQDTHGVTLNNIAILFRAHYQSLELELELNKRGIPYDMRGGLRFFEQAHIKDVVAHLKAFSLTSDELSWSRMLRLQPGVGQVAARNIWQAVSGFDTVQAALGGTVAVSGKAQVAWQQVRSLFQEMLAVQEQSVAELVRLVVKRGYDEYVKANFENAQDRSDDLTQLISFAGNYKTVEDFLSDVALSEGFKGQTIVAQEEKPEEAVTLSTVHQAKGLEWKVVFVVGLIEGQFPHAKVYEHPEQIEEERRLFYVATTRAQDQLYLTYATVNNRGDILARPSQFVSELPERVYEEWQIDKMNYSKLEDGEVTYESEDGEQKKSFLDFYM